MTRGLILLGQPAMCLGSDTAHQEPHSAGWHSTVLQTSTNVGPESDWIASFSFRRITGHEKINPSYGNTALVCVCVCVCVCVGTP